ncbi:MAG: c-type cytochrome, partial [Pseudomonadota bacterium]
MKKTLVALVAVAGALAVTAFAAADSTAQLAAAKGCFVCHAVKTEDNNGPLPLAPSYEQIAERYVDHNVDKAEYLVDRIIRGTVGAEQNWADDISMRFMPPNVNLSRNDASALVTWILTGKGTTAEAAELTASLALATNSGCMTCHAVE